MKKIIWLLLISSVCFIGCGLRDKYTLRDFMCGLDEGHIEVTEEGGRAATSDPVELIKNVYMEIDFTSHDGYYYIYFTLPGADNYYSGFVDIPEDIEIHNRNRDIYSITYKEIRYIDGLIEIYSSKLHKEYACIVALNSVLDGDDYMTLLYEYDDYCEKHDWFYDKESYCPMCWLENYKKK